MRNRTLLVAGMALAASIGAASGDTIRVRTDRGIFLVEVADPAVSVRGEGDELVVSRAGGDEVRIRFDPEVPNQAPGGATFSIRRDGKVVVSARRISQRGAATSPEGAGGKILVARSNLSAWGLAISADGKTMVSGQQDVIRAWDLPALSVRFAAPTGKTVRRVAMTPDGSTIASAEFQYQGPKAIGNVVIRDGKTGEVRRTMEPQVESVHGVAISPDGQVVVSSSWSETDIRVWSVETGRQVGTLKGHSGAVSTLAYSPDGKTLASCGDSTVRLWDVDTGAVRMILRGHQKAVESVAFGADGKTLASGGFDETARVWDVASGKQIASFDHDDPVLSVAISPDGKAVAASSARWGNGFYGQAPAEVKVWDVAAGKPRVSLPNQPSQVFAMAFTPDGKALVTASLSGAVVAWDLAAPRGDRPEGR